MNNSNPKTLHKAQNAHILDSLEQVQEAVKALVKEGHTVTEFKVGGAWPRIEILPSQQCQKLQRATTTTKSTPNGGYLTQHSAYVNDCEVHWIDRNYNSHCR